MHSSQVSFKTFWKHIKKKYEKKSVQSDTLNTDECYEHFKNVYGRSMEPPLEQQTNLGDNLDTDLDTEISESEIRDAIFSQKKTKKQKKKNGKGCGLDCLSAELVKHSYDIISRF